MKYVVMKREKESGKVVESVKKFASLVSACKFCRKMNGHLTMASPLRVFYYAPEKLAMKH